MNTRTTAAKILAQVITQQRALTTTHEDALTQELCYGTLRWYHRLDAVAKLLLAKPLTKKDADIQALLLIGLYQLIYLRVPDHAAISETVDATRELKKTCYGLWLF